MKKIEVLHSEIKWIENGQTNISGEAYELYQSLDRFFARLASIKMAKFFKFPNFIQAKELNKIDYFKSFPHLINFPVNMKNSEENLKNFINDEKCNLEGQVKLKEINSVCDCLTPAACYHFYIHFQNSKIEDTLYLTTLANCYRKEDYYLPLERQWNFTMREIVCMGKASDVKNFLESYRKLLSKIFSKLQLEIDWDIATDPFFDPTNNPKFIMQSLDPVKYEMIFRKNLSIGSTNYHRTYFGEAFNIKINEDHVSTGCVAFGMERWMFAILKQFGSDSKNWPNFDIILNELLSEDL